MLEIDNSCGMRRNAHIPVLLILLLASFSSSAWCHEKKDIAEKLERGRDLLDAGDLVQAAKFLEEVVASEPAHQTARSMLFTCYRFAGIECYGQSRYHDAIESWRKALTIDPQNQEIKNFITRCESEMKAIARLVGDTAVAEVEMPSLLVSSLAPVDSGSLSQSSVVGSKGISTDEPTIITSRRTIELGLSSGIVLGTGSSHNPKTAAAFMGYFSYIPEGHRLGARLDGMYSRFFRDSHDDASAPRHLAVSGLSVRAIISSEVSRFTSVDYSAGLGVYEVILTEPADGQNLSGTRKSSVLGIKFGLGWRKAMGAFAATVDASYTHLCSSLSPNLLQISVGLASH